MRESLGSADSSQPTPPARWSRALVLSIAACAVLVVALAITASLVLVRVGSSGDIPTVRDLSGQLSSGTVVFTWSDPGLQPDDAYQVAVGDSPPSIQRGTEFRVDAKPGERVCVTITVNRDGRTGQPSAQKCVERANGS